MVKFAYQLLRRDFVMSKIDVQGNSGNVDIKGDTIKKNTKITISIGSVIILQ